MMDKVELLRAMPVIERPLQWLEQHPTLHGLVLSAFGLRRPIFVDYRVRPAPRHGYGRPEHPEITALIEKNRASYAELLTGFTAYADLLATIPSQGGKGLHWHNGWLPGPDAVALYGLVTDRNPKRYLEIGSGNSTRFVRRAIEDHGLRTTITSVDPQPRADVDALCDTVLRERLEDVAVDVFTGLEPDDIVFLDGSHRVLMGSDVTVFFFEILPLLRPGVLVHIHDIWLPRDYPPDWRYRYYSEQYLLAAYLLADPARFEVVLPGAFIDNDEQLRALTDPLWQRIGHVEKYPPTSFWLRVR
jgi:predicted O-methyltransferase YrrM